MLNRVKVKVNFRVSVHRVGLHIRVCDRVLDHVNITVHVRVSGDVRVSRHVRVSFEVRVRLLTLVKLSLRL